MASRYCWSMPMYLVLPRRASSRVAIVSMDFASSSCVDHIHLAMASPTPSSCDPQRSPGRIRGTSITEYWRSGIPLVDFDVGRPDYLAPLLGFGSDESSEIGGRARKGCRTQIGEPRFYVRFGKSYVYLLVQLVDDFAGCVLWCGNPEPITSLEARWNSLTVGTSGRISERLAVV